MFQRKFVEKIKTHVLCSITFPPPTPTPREIRAVYEIVWKNMVEADRPQMTIWRVRIACWITKVTETHSEYVIQLSHCDNGYANVPQCYVIRTLPVFRHDFCEQSCDLTVLPLNFKKLQWTVLQGDVLTRTSIRRSAVNIRQTDRIKASSPCHDITQVTRPWIIS